MLDPHSLSVAQSYWAHHLNRSAQELFAEPCVLCPHGPDLQDYHGVYALFRNDAAIISLPSGLVDVLQPLLRPLFHQPTTGALAEALTPVTDRVIGPAVVQYAAALPSNIDPPEPQARPLKSNDAPAMKALEQACDPVEWEHGGSALSQPCFGSFVGATLAALASYEIWGGTIAHISVITHPAHRGHGYGQAVVALAMAHALAAGLLPQYRTLASNLPSLRIAEKLGFHTYATSMAVRLKPAEN